MPDPTDLYDIQLSEVSLVDRGDNPGAEVIFFKRPPDDDSEEPAAPEEKGVVKRVLKAVGDVLGWSEDEVEKAEAVAYEPDFDRIQAEKFRFKIEDELYSMIASLQDAIMIALSPGNLADSESKMRASLSQFNSAAEEAIGAWSSGKSAFSKEEVASLEKAGRKISQGRLKSLKDMHEAMGRSYETLTRMLADVKPAEQADVEKSESDEGTVNEDVTDTMDKAAPKTLEEALALIKELRAELAEAKGTAGSGGKGSSAMRSADEKKPGGTGGGTKGKIPPQFKKDSEADDEEKFFKDMPELMRKRWEAMEKQAEADRGRIEKMEREKEEGEYIAKARADHLPGPEEIGKAMRRLDKGEPEEGDFEKVQKAYQALINQASTADLFKQRSRAALIGGSGGGGAFAKATEKAREMMASDPELTMAKARSKVWETNPDLVKEYREEGTG